VSKRLTYILLLMLTVSACTSVGTSPSTDGQTPTLPEPNVTTIPAPDPDAAAVRFLEAWRERDYVAMYGMLSSLTQDGISRDAFIDRYNQIERAIALSSIETQIISSLVINPQTAEVRYRVIYDSAVLGELPRENRMELRREGENWRIAWTDSLIMPELSEGFGLRLYQYAPTRANIYDRNGLAMAAQTDAVALWIVPNQIGDEDAEEAMLSTLRRLLDVPTNDDIRELYDSFRGTDFYIALGEVSYEDFRLVEGTLASVGGVQWRRYSTRFYPGGGLTPFAGGLASHSVGYVSQIQQEVLETYLSLGYQGDEYVGQIGLELAYESQLRGEPGGTLYLTDADGKEIQILTDKDSAPPYAVYTTLDRELQQYAQQAIEDFVGTVVVLERDTGAILAMASSPDFDPNLFDTENPNFSVGLSELFQNPNQPLLNRATLGLYPPGSVFKIVTMAAALESGYYEPETIYNCGLEFRELPGITLYDWRYEKELPGAGAITLIQGLEKSCNPYFWHIGLDLYNQGLEEALPDMAKAFGLGQLTGVTIDETAGLIPDPEVKNQLFGEDWAARDAVQVAIGQSFLQVTPLQVARFVAAIGNGGTLYRPQIVSSVQNAEGDVLHEFEPEVQGQLPVSLDNIEAIHRAMVNVIRDPNATAYRRFLNFSINVAGKTGTATTGDLPILTPGLLDTHLKNKKINLISLSLHYLSSKVRDRIGQRLFFVVLLRHILRVDLNPSIPGNPESEFQKAQPRHQLQKVRTPRRHQHPKP
jgi:penicillin-binding protein 2